MKRAIAAALIASTLLTGLSISRAAEAAEKSGESQNDAGRTMDAPYIAVPVIRDGLLRNYLFVSVRFNIAPGNDLWRTREKAHFLRDALVRASHTNALADPNNPDALNQGRAIALYANVARQVLGAQAIQSVSIISTYSSRGGSVREPPQAPPPERPSSGGGHH
jgi:hypothetical protein